LAARRSGPAHHALVPSCPREARRRPVAAAGGALPLAASGFPGHRSRCRRTWRPWMCWPLCSGRRSGSLGLACRLPYGPSACRPGRAACGWLR